jgi:competence protein ComEA
MLRKVSKKIGFTETEIKVILFLAVGFLIGFVIKLYKDDSQPEYKSYDYTKEDSIFNFYKDKAEEKLIEKKNNDENNIVDSKAEVLDFKSTKYKKKESLPLPAEKSIDINRADIKTLVRLPGIGEKTAQKIIELRNEKEKFEKLDELLEVKGIGKTKFNKIKKFLYIK